MAKKGGKKRSARAGFQEQRMEFMKEIEQNCLISSVTTYQDLLDLQKQLFKSQMQQLKYMVKTHRELTGVNPLSQEMVAGPLSIKTDIDDGPSWDEVQPDLEELDKHFIDEKIALMKKEESFSGQVKLVESILQIENPSVLSWLLIKGGMMILATWLSQAVIEEQTSVLNIILKVLHILPLQTAFLAQKTIIYKIVTKLQFYWTSGLDISESAKTLLTKWSDMSAKSQDSKDGKSRSVLLSETQDPREVQMVENPDQSTTVKIPKDPHQEYIVLSDSDDEAPQQEGRDQVPDFIPATGEIRKIDPAKAQDLFRGRKHLVSVAGAKTWPERVDVSNEDAADSTEDMIEQLTSKAAFGPSFSTFWVV